MMNTEISSVYAWASVTRDMSPHLVQAVCDVINAFNRNHSNGN